VGGWGPQFLTNLKLEILESVVRRNLGTVLFCGFSYNLIWTIS
jgi:hypothetical protein